MRSGLPGAVLSCTGSVTCTLRSVNLRAGTAPLGAVQSTRPMLDPVLDEELALDCDDVLAVDEVVVPELAVVVVLVAPPPPDDVPVELVVLPLPLHARRTAALAKRPEEETKRRLRMAPTYASSRVRSTIGDATRRVPP